MSETAVKEHPQYWGSPFCASVELMRPDDDPHGMARCMNAQINDIIALYKPDKNAGYVRHIYQYRVTVEDIAANPKLALSTDNVVDPDRFSGEYVTYGACYIVGPLPETLTTKRDFKEIPWPPTPTKNQ